MATNLPPLVYEAPQVAPSAGGLYGAANVVPSGTPSRLVGGVHLIPTNCGAAHGLLPVDCPPPEDMDIEGDAAALDVPLFPATGVFAADECGLLGRTQEEANARAVHQLSLYERPEVEAFVAGLFVDRVEDVRTAGGENAKERIAQAVAIAEATLGEMGVTGVLHVSAGQAVAATRAGVVRWQGGVPLTPLGHRWAFGGGYGALGDTMYVTGPVVVMRSEVGTYLTVAPRKNNRLVVAQREVAVAWECLEMGIDFGAPEGEA